MTEIVFEPRENRQYMFQIVLNANDVSFEENSLKML